MVTSAVPKILAAAAFAAHKHRDQRRKDAAASPYINHPIALANILANEGGITDASNTDPYASKPTASNHWIKTGPHVMVVGADASFYDAYPKSPDPDTSVPYVMWAGTPYQHLMAPVRRVAHASSAMKEPPKEASKDAAAK